MEKNENETIKTADIFQDFNIMIKFLLTVQSNINAAIRNKKGHNGDSRLQFQGEFQVGV